jgi:hypothetical protein
LVAWRWPARSPIGGKPRETAGKQGNSVFPLTEGKTEIREGIEGDSVFCFQPTQKQQNGIRGSELQTLKA